MRATSNAQTNAGSSILLEPPNIRRVGALASQIVVDAAHTNQPDQKKMTVDGTRTLRQSADPKPAISGRADGSNSRNRSAGSHVQPCPREVHHKRKKRGLGC